MPIDLAELPMPVTLRPSKPIGDEELMRFSERNKPFKIERNKEGELTIMTPVGGIGGTHELYVASSLFVWTRHSGGGIAFGPNTGFNLSDGSCLSPDAAWLAQERWRALTPEQQAGYPPVCPEFVIEVRSRTDSRRMVESKMELWIKNGARLAWLVDPVEESVSIYRPGGSPVMLEGPKMVSGEGPVAGFALACGPLWT